MLNLTIEEIKSRITEGYKLALKRLIEQKQKENSFLVVSDKDGNVIKIPARDIKS